MKQSTGCDDFCICANGRVGDTRRARRLEYLTIGWNLIEAGVALGAGIVAGSIALIGFGVDTMIEILSSLILLWRLLSIIPMNNANGLPLSLWASVSCCWPLTWGMKLLPCSPQKATGSKLSRYSSGHSRPVRHALAGSCQMARRPSEQCGAFRRLPSEFPLRLSFCHIVGWTGPERCV